MQKGIFKSFKHDHFFEDFENDKTLMKDIFDYKSPFGIFGKIADKLFLKSYMRSFLTEKNQVIKQFAESDKWKHILNITS